MIKDKVHSKSKTILFFHNYHKISMKLHSFQFSGQLSDQFFYRQIEYYTVTEQSNSSVTASRTKYVATDKKKLSCKNEALHQTLL